MERIWQEGYEQVTIFYDPKSNTRSIISIHNTNLGPSLGGTRIYPYKNLQSAMDDVLRLSKGMTYKAAVANLPLGGGKSIIAADPHREKNPAMLESHAKFVDSLGGRYITAEDSGTSAKDIDHMRKFTKYVVGTSSEKGGSGDPSPFTAKGVTYGMEACAKEILHKELGSCTVAVQGVGNVGSHLVRYLKQKGCKLYITDVDTNRARQICEETGATPMTQEQILDVECDIFSPNALGGVIDEKSIPRLKCKVVAGAANNQLLDDKCGNKLYDRNIFYAPDYVINAGGLVSVCCEWLKYDSNKRDELVTKIGETMSEIIHSSRDRREPSYIVAQKIAESRLKAKKK